MSRLGSTVAVATICLSLIALSACGAASQTPQGSTSSPPGTTTGPIGAMPVKPHLAKQPGGRALATGWLRRIDLEGGFWALVAVPPGVTTDAPMIIAVLLPGKVSAAQIGAHDGAYLVVAGRLSAGASIRNAGAEIQVASIKTLGMGQ
jgi:hypothetical protein